MRSDTEQGQPTRQTGKKKRALARKPKQTKTKGLDTSEEEPKLAFS